MEKGRAGTHHALAESLERGFPRMASGVLGDGRKIPRQRVRHSRWRNGSDVPSPRVRNSPECGKPPHPRRALLGSQQHDHDQRPEDGQVFGQLHHTASAFQRTARETRPGIFPDDDPLLHPSSALPQHTGFQQRGVAGGRKGAQEGDAGVEGSASAGLSGGNHRHDKGY